VDLERHLEDWLADDISLIDPGLLVIQRQMHVEGGILDLLCVDPQGVATVVEVKRGRLIRETVAQAVDYASCIAELSAASLAEAVCAYPNQGSEDSLALNALLSSSDETREVAIIVVGVGQEPGLERIIDFLGRNAGISIRAVTFDVFDAGDGAQILVREEIDVPEAQPPSTNVDRAAAVIAAAGGPESSAGRRLLKLVAAGERNGLYARPYKWSFMLTPQERRTRGLFVFGRWGGEVALQYSTGAIAEFFPIDAERAQAILGPDIGTIPIPDEPAADDWSRRIDELFAVISAGAVGQIAD
jgi:hypothetical protein